MNTQPQIPLWKRVVEQKHYRNNLSCHDLDALAAMLPSALLELKFDEVEPEAFALPEEYTTEDIKEAVNKVIKHLGLDRLATGHKHQYPLNVERRVSVTFKRFTPEEKVRAIVYINDRERRFIDIYFDLDSIESRMLAPSSVMEVVIHEVCHEMLRTCGYKGTKRYLNISPTQVTEYLTEICIVYTGFGKIMSNSSRQAEQRGLVDPGYIDWWQVSYLRQKFFNAPVPFRHSRLSLWLEWDDLIEKCQWLKNVLGGSKMIMWRLLWLAVLIVSFVTLFGTKHNNGLLPETMNFRIRQILCITLLMGMLFPFFPWKKKPMLGCLGFLLCSILNVSVAFLVRHGLKEFEDFLGDTPWRLPAFVLLIGVCWFVGIKLDSK